MTPKPMEISRQTMRSALYAGLVEVTFRKKDGSLRTMMCTTNPTLIDAALEPTGGTLAEQSHAYTDQIRCVDFDIMEWRSFNYESVQTFRIDPDTCGRQQGDHQMNQTTLAEMARLQAAAVQAIKDAHDFAVSNNISMDTLFTGENADDNDGWDESADEEEFDDSWSSSSMIC